MNDKIKTWLSVGLKNFWIRQAVDPPFDRYSFCECQTVGDLVGRLLQGNWSLGMAFFWGDVCCINQVDVGDEWLIIKGDLPFESFTVRHIPDLRERLVSIQAATKEQCKALEYAPKYNEVQS